MWQQRIIARRRVNGGGNRRKQNSSPPIPNEASRCRRTGLTQGAGLGSMRQTRSTPPVIEKAASPALGCCTKANKISVIYYVAKHQELPNDSAPG